MHIVHVFVHVIADQVDAFKAATLGIARFDVIQQIDDPTRFVLVEVYRTPEAPAQHKETAHYLRWRETVAPMMAEPRTSIQYTNIFPADADW